MNLGLLAFGAVTSGSLKKQVAIVFATLVIIVALPFTAVFAMGSSVVSFLSGVPSLAAAESQGFYLGGPVNGDTYEWGNCTYWVFAMRLMAGYPIPTTWGNANTWDDRARSDGYVVDHSPEVGAVFQTDAGNWGHVAYVSSVNNQNGQWTISEMNFIGLNIVDKRTFSSEAAASYNFIHNKAGASLWTPQPISLP
jgi:surface antigen